MKTKSKHYGIKCLECLDKVYSYYTHDFVSCTCGSIFVDGGLDYLRFGTTTGKKWKYCSKSIYKIKIKEYAYYELVSDWIWIQNKKMDYPVEKGYVYLGVL